LTRGRIKNVIDKNNYNIHSLNDTLWEPEDKSCCRKPRPQRGSVSAEVQVLNAKKKNKLKTQGSTCRKIHVKKGAQL